MEASGSRGRVRAEPATKRIRVILGGIVVADTTDAVYVWENPSYPQYYIPLADIAPGALKETGTASRSPSRGTARHFSVQGGDRVADDILRSSRSVRIEVAGVAVAETIRPTFLFETGLPRRTYLPKLDDAPFRESAPIAGLVAFYDEHVDVFVEGELQPRPQTPFS